MGSRSCRSAQTSRLRLSPVPNLPLIAHHIVWTGYGGWLPNDPRGSFSREIGSEKISQLGNPHYGRRRKQPTRQIVNEFQSEARQVLKYPLLKFTQQQFEIIADGFSDAIRMHSYTCYACAILPNHVHLLIRKHRHKAEQMIEILQEASRLRISRARIADPDHPIWTVGGWKAFLHHPDAIRRVIRYIENNPAKERLPMQHWDFVQPYDGWPLHPGHNPNTPYAKRLREQRD